MVIRAGLFKVRCRPERMVHLRGRLDNVSLGPAGLSLGVFFLRRWGLGLQFVVLVWNFKNGVGGFVGFSQRTPRGGSHICLLSMVYCLLSTVKKY